MPLLINDIPIACINRAAVTYHVPAPVILSILRLENGRNGDARRNKNGTLDFGVFQINSVWLRALEKYGYTRHDLQYNPCRSTYAATWIISQNISRNLPTWQALAAWHSMTPKHNQSYRTRLKTVYTSLVS